MKIKYLVILTFKGKEGHHAALGVVLEALAHPQIPEDFMGQWETIILEVLEVCLGGISGTSDDTGNSLKEILQD